jgi:hypothetical protein
MSNSPPITKEKYRVTHWIEYDFGYDNFCAGRGKAVLSKWGREETYESVYLCTNAIFW